MPGRTVLFSGKVPKHVARRSAARRSVSVAASAVSGNGNLLPWQAAMDEIKKRKDLKSIMIIGAGPIVIGQASQYVHVPGTRRIESPQVLCSRGNL